MRVIVASTCVPFVDGGGVQIVDWTVEALRNRGFEAEALFVPFSDDREVVLSQVAALRSLDLSGACDVLVPVRWPAHMIRHPRKRPWFIHHLRLFMDLWDWPANPVPHTASTIALREFLMPLDTAALAECEQVFTNSQVISDRVCHFNHLASKVLYPPLRDGQPVPGPGAYEPFAFYPSRVNEAKRQVLAVEAAVVAGVRIVVGGVCEDVGYERRLRELAASAPGLVDLRLGWMSEADKEDLLSRCSAVLYVPVDEDSYGYPSLEAYRHGKPVISCVDSGGTSELIVDGVNGRLVEPSAAAVAEAIAGYARDPAAARAAGQAGRDRVRELGIDWDHVIAQLTGTTE